LHPDNQRRVTEHPIRGLRYRQKREALERSTASFERQDTVANGQPGKSHVTFPLAATDHRTAVGFLLDWLESQQVFPSVKAVGHRVVQGYETLRTGEIAPETYIRGWSTIWYARSG
jgi:acetate kinase